MSGTNQAEQAALSFPLTWLRQAGPGRVAELGERKERVGSQPQPSPAQAIGGGLLRSRPSAGLCAGHAAQLESPEGRPRFESRSADACSLWNEWRPGLLPEAGAQ